MAVLTNSSDIMPPIVKTIIIHSRIDNEKKNEQPITIMELIIWIRIVSFTQMAVRIPFNAYEKDFNNE